MNTTNILPKHRLPGQGLNLSFSILNKMNNNIVSKTAIFAYIYPWQEIYE